MSVDTDDDVVLLRCLRGPLSFLGRVGIGFDILSYSSALLSVSLSSCSDRLGGRVIGGRCKGGSGGSWMFCARGDDGFEPLGPGFEFDRGRTEGDKGMEE